MTHPHVWSTGEGQEARECNLSSILTLTRLLLVIGFSTGVR